MSGVDVSIEQDVGPPVRLVTAADVEHDRVGVDRDRDAPPMERRHPPPVRDRVRLQLTHLVQQLGRRQRQTSALSETHRILPRWSAVPDPIPETTRRPGVAAFDVDGTLTSRDCVVPFARQVNGTLGSPEGC